MSEVHQNHPPKSFLHSGKIRTADVVVVGGGIAGKACALGLAQMGLQTLEIAPDLDKAVPAPQGLQWGQRIYAFSPSTQKLLAHLQIWDAVDQARMQPVRDMRIYGDRGEKNDQLHLSAFEAGTPQLAWIGESNVIEHTLDQASRFQNKLERIADIVKEKKWSPVDFYVGGAEHATRHLIYARFWHKFLYDIGVVPTIEPFARLRNQGMILAYAYERSNG